MLRRQFDELTQRLDEFMSRLSLFILPLIAAVGIYFLILLTLPSLNQVVVLLIALGVAWILSPSCESRIVTSRSQLGALAAVWLRLSRSERKSFCKRPLHAQTTSHFDHTCNEL